MAEQEDKVLLREIAQGDGECFRIFYEKYYKRILVYAYGLCRNPQDAQDLAQEVFLIIQKKASTFEGENPGGAWPWLKAIVLNLSRNLGRKNKKRRKNVSLDEHGEEKIAPLIKNTSAFSPEKKMEMMEFALAFDEALEKLTPQRKQIIILRELQGTTYEETAEIMGISLSLVKVTLWRARKNLAGHLRDFQ